MLNLDALIRALTAEQVPFVLIGGLAAVVRGASYVTADIDICHSRKRDDLHRLARALSPFEPRLRGVPPEVLFTLDAAALRASALLTLTTQVGDLDLIGDVPGLGSYESVRGWAEPVDVYGYPILVLTLEGLIRAKQTTRRPKDLLLLPELQSLLALRSANQQHSDD